MALFQKRHCSDGLEILKKEIILCGVHHWWIATEVTWPSRAGKTPIANLHSQEFHGKAKSSGVCVLRRLVELQGRQLTAVWSPVVCYDILGHIRNNKEIPTVKNIVHVFIQMLKKQNPIIKEEPNGFCQEYFLELNFRLTRIGNRFVVGVIDKGRDLDKQSLDDFHLWNTRCGV